MALGSLSFSRKVALRYLWSKRSEAFITIITIISILGVALGVSVINITMSIMTGFEYSLRDKVVGSAHVIVQRIGGEIDQWQEVSERVRTIPGVRAVSAFTQHQALLSVGKRSRGVLIQGIERESAAASELARYLEGDRTLDVLESPPPVLVILPDGSEDEVNLPPLIVGRELVRQVGLPIGDAVTLLSPDVTSSPFGLTPRMRRFVVAATYKSGLAGYEEGLAYTSVKAAQQFFRMGDAVSGLEVMVNEIDRSPRIAQDIYTALNVDFGGGYIARDWTERNKNLWEALQLEKQVYFIVLLLLIVLASFTIVSSLIMIVLEKRSDIAILRTLGASTRSIANIFLFQGAVIGLLGTGLGLLGGYLGAVGLETFGFPLPKGIFPQDVLPIKLELINFVASGVAAFLICFLSTLYPAWRASRLDPAEILRYE